MARKKHVFRVEICCDNAAFYPNATDFAPEREISEILTRLSVAIADSKILPGAPFETHLRDKNGNIVGKAALR